MIISSLGRSNLRTAGVAASRSLYPPHISCAVSGCAGWALSSERRCASTRWASLHGAVARAGSEGVGTAPAAAPHASTNSSQASQGGQHPQQQQQQGPAQPRKEEQCVVVNEANEVVGSAPRSILVKNRMLGRGIYCLVFDHQGRLFVSKRSMSKDVWPGCWDTTTAGVVQAGEEYEDTAVRELSEELGLTQQQAAAALHKLGPFRWQDRYCDVWGCAFTAMLPAPGDAGSGELGVVVSLQAEEVDEGGFLPLEKVEALLADPSQQFTPVGRHVLRMFLDARQQQKQQS